MIKLPIRNIGIFGKDGSGKTTLTESIMFLSGIKKEMGSVANGTTMADFEEEEQKRKFTLHSSVCNTVWNKNTFNIIDTPGYSAFQYDTQSVLNAVDAALFVFGADSEISAQARFLYRYASGRKLPIIGVMTFLDKENADFNGTLEMLERKLDKKPVVLQIPYGEKANFKGFVDVVVGKLFEFPKSKDGSFQEKEIPAELKSRYEDLRMELLEEISMADEDLMNKFLEEGDLTPEETEIALAKSFQKGDLLPVVVASGEYLLGVRRIMSYLTQWLTPEYLTKTYTAKKADGSTHNVVADSPLFTGTVFKTFVDPFQGIVNVVKVNSGSLSPNSEVFNPSTESIERIGKLYVLRGKDLVEVDGANAGDVIAIPKLKDTATGHTLTDSKKSIFFFESLEKPSPVIQYAITLANKKDEDKLSGVIQKIMISDPTIELIHDGELHQILLAGQGQIQLQAVQEEIRRKYKIDVQYGTPKVSYRETIKGKAEAQGKYKKQSGGKGQYGDCHIRVKPRQSGEGFLFVDKIVGGVIPRNFIPSVEKGIIERSKRGIQKGYPVVDFEVELFYGSYHDVDSSDMAFQVAGSLAFQKSMPNATPIILEPYMNVEIFVEDDLVGTIMGDISSRRGRVSGTEAADGEQVVKAIVPLKEIMEYEPTLNQITSGNARFTVKFSHYEEFRGDLTSIPQNGEDIQEEE
ncbi:elongation factor G [bacterium]|nr:elongation factor G [bacterium]